MGISETLKHTERAHFSNIFRLRKKCIKTLVDLNMVAKLENCSTNIKVQKFSLVDRCFPYCSGILYHTALDRGS
jgi:hypothetical protein